jgi:hypothetical protein
MNVKTKTVKTPLDQLATIAQHAGLVMMTAAATVGMLELPEHPNKVIVPNQPAFAFAGENTNVNSENNNPIRREKEEVETHYVSYASYQRTPGRTGKW